jgi:diacylglycerol kinase
MRIKITNSYYMSYVFAIRGIRIAIVQERQMLLHIAASMMVIVLNIILKLSKTDWIITLILIGLVLMAEIFNTAIEKMADRITKVHDPLIRDIKDLSAGAVLTMGIVAAITAMIIYYPYIF